MKSKSIFAKNSSNRAHWEAKPRGSVPFGQQGGVIDITVHRIGTPRFAARSIEIVKDSLVEAEFFEGDFLGNWKRTLEPLDGKTRIKLRSNIKTNRLLYSLVYPLVRRIHSDVVQQGYNTFLPS